MATPHLGYVTEETYRVFFADAAEDIAAWLAGKPERTLNKPAPICERAAGGAVDFARGEAKYQN